MGMHDAHVLQPNTPINTHFWGYIYAFIFLLITIHMHIKYAFLLLYTHVCVLSCFYPCFLQYTSYFIWTAAERRGKKGARNLFLTRCKTTSQLNLNQ